MSNPIKPIWKGEIHPDHMMKCNEAPYCPQCNKVAVSEDNYYYNYCPWCGQEFDWSDINWDDPGFWEPPKFVK